jgi:chemotaxis protein methyltransferase CheR
MAQLFKFGVQNKSIDRGTRPAAGSSSMEMSDKTFEEFREWIYQKSGIYYTDSKKYLLEGRVARRLSANRINSYEEYLNKLKLNRGDKEELDRLYEAITINETYFYRAPNQFDAFQNILIPEIIENKKNEVAPTIRIWSAASSTGEEAYTLAIIINENLKRKYPGVKFQIIGTDINMEVLETARKGIFKQYAIRNIPEPLLRRYFTQQQNSYILNDEIKRMVKFAQVNLYDSSAVRQISGCDIIFCANVLIYFDNTSKQKVVSNLYNSLNRGGYLFIGYSESLHGVSRAFKLIHLPKSMAYKKE